MINMELIKLYMEGDSIGAPYEGKRMFAEPNRNFGPVPGGTDETDTVRCWLEFEKSGQNINPLNWARYFTKNHRICGYGKAYPDFFQLVKWLEKKGTLASEKLLEMSIDRNSFGNGCLALVYPMYCYAVKRGMNPAMLVQEYTAITHAHPDALEACFLLGSYIHNASFGIMEGNHGYPAEGVGGHADAMSTLTTALWCADRDSKEDVIKECLFIGGDVDSTLSLSLLLWGFLRGGHDVLV